MDDLRGRIERRWVAQGSKSEREAVVLIDATGQAHVLRRVGGNPFRDPQLDALLGQSLLLLGEVRDSYFLVHQWQPIPEG